MMSQQEERGDDHTAAGEIVANPSFDYGSLSPSLARFLRVQADRIKHQYATSIVQIGKALLEAKRHLSHGEFIAWVEAEVHVPIRTVQAYMRVASWATGKGSSVAKMSPTVLHLLSAPSTPPEFTTEIVKKAEAGEFVAPAVVRKQLSALRQERLRESDERLASAANTDAVYVAPDNETSTLAESLNDIVEIFRARLTRFEFERVRDLLSSDSFFTECDVAQRFRAAFSSRETSTSFVAVHRSSVAASF